MDTPASAAGIASYAKRPNYHMADYVVAPSGWLTFNQFFAREIKPGKRPIAAPCDDKVIVSPADSVFAGAWDVDANSKVTVKGVTWPIAKLLDGSPYQDAFKNGIYTHSFLNIDDYHRYHVPVAGEIKEVRRIEGRVYVNVIRNADGSLQPVDGGHLSIQPGTRPHRHRFAGGGPGRRAADWNGEHLLGEPDP